MKAALSDTGVLLCSLGDVPQVCELLGVSHAFLKGEEREPEIEISDISRKMFVFIKQCRETRLGTEKTKQSFFCGSELISKLLNISES